jgi:hypothetical protein
MFLACLKLHSHTKLLAVGTSSLAATSIKSAPPRIRSNILMPPATFPPAMRYLPLGSLMNPRRFCNPVCTCLTGVNEPSDASEKIAIVSPEVQRFIGMYLETADSGQIGLTEGIRCAPNLSVRGINESFREFRSCGWNLNLGRTVFSPVDTCRGGKRRRDEGRECLIVVRNLLRG